MLQQIKESKPVYNPTRSVWWRSPHLKKTLRAGFALRTHASHKLMTSQSSITRLVYLIPLGSIVALLLVVLSIFMVPWDSNDRYASALEIDRSNSNHDTITTNDTTMLASSPSASLTITNPSLSSTGKAGEIVSMSSNVSINAELVSDYTLQIASGNGNGNGTVLEGPNTINSITTATTMDNMEDNTWGYSWDNNTSYEGITTTPITLESSNVTTNSINITKPLTFVAKFSKDAIAGHYKTKVNLSLTTAPKALTTYTITYDANGGSGAANPASQSIESYDSSHTFTVAAQGTLTKTGYSFLGWSESSTATTATYIAGSSTITLANNSPSKVLYAVWKQKLTLSSIANMQDMTAEICAASAEEETKQLKDTRDNKSYWVTKLKDGNCWMTQNLDYDGGGTRVTELKNWISSAGGNNNIAEYYDPGTKILQGYALEDFQTGQDTHKLIGNYYSWGAATNGTGNISSGDAKGSICQSGWTLPTRNDFITAFNGMSSAILENAPYYFLRTGHTYPGAINSLGSNSYYLTSTAYDAINAYWFTFYSKAVITNYYRYYGGCIRCMFKSNI